MASLHCKYCGAYIKDTDKKCPECGAINDHYRAQSDGKPRTIDELKSWYKARNLPPEETTRFFIGKNITEPRAFGIYEENGRFIVYKNKGNGQRAIRYEGEDEAYAVNELYLRLKEEILNQKQLNANRRNGIYGTTSQTGNRKKRGWIATIVIATLSLLLPMSIALLMFKTTNSFMNSYSNEYYFDYFYGSDDSVYFLEKYASDSQSFIWWKYNNALQEWEPYQEYYTDNYKNIIGPEFVNVDAAYNSIASFVYDYGGDPDKLDISASHAYIDAGHRPYTQSSYYAHDNKVYYYLDDMYSSYGSSDNTGWYVYENDGWHYLCSDEEKTILGEELWYHADNYRIGDTYLDAYTFQGTTADNWNVSDFSQTSWYQSYLDNNAAHEDYVNTHSYDSHDSDWGSDSDWDWDSGDSWDSGGSDWDSDW